MLMTRMREGCRSKFMLTNLRKSFLMIVRVKDKNIRGLVIPIPLFVISYTLNSLADLIWFGEWVFGPLIRMHLRKKGKHRWLNDVPFSVLIRQFILLIDELRKHGRLKMVEVEHDQTRVNVDLY